MALRGRQGAGQGAEGSGGRVLELGSVGSQTNLPKKFAPHIFVTFFVAAVVVVVAVVVLISHLAFDFNAEWGGGGSKVNANSTKISSWLIDTNDKL